MIPASNTTTLILTRESGQLRLTEIPIIAWAPTGEALVATAHGSLAPATDIDGFQCLTGPAIAPTPPPRGGMGDGMVRAHLKARL